MVGLGRLELPTSRLSGVRSNQAELQAHNLKHRHEWPRASLPQPAEPVSRGLGPTVGRRIVLHAFGTRTWKGYAGGDAGHL